MRSRRRLGRVIALVAASSVGMLVACNALTGLDADYKLKGGSSGSSGQDGDTPGDGAPTVDAKNDAPVVEDGGDASVDSPSDAAFCENKGPDDFCWDFEAPATTPKWGWSDFNAAGGSTVTVVGGLGYGGSKGLRATLTSSAGQAYLRQQVGTSRFTDFRRHKLSFVFSLKKDQLLYGSVIGALGFDVTANKYAGLSIFAATGTPGALDMSDPPASGPTAVSVPAVKDRWYSVEISLDRSVDSGPYTSSMTVDGVAVDEGQTFTATGILPTQLLVGLAYPGPGPGGVEVIIDDVVLRQTK